MIKEIRIYGDDGTLLSSEPISPEGVNVSISVEGLESRNLQAALAEIVTAISNINAGSGYTSGVTVDGVGVLGIDMGNIASGTTIDGMTLTELLQSAYGTPSSAET